jgi:hypothetical protein
MYRTCLFCNKRFGENEVLESFPVGRRLAFDQAMGRLWVVCRRCKRWNLSPFEERWEAIEDCERRFRGARKRASSDNIGLAKLDEGLELVRIGQPLRPEFAAWRYGGQFRRRWRRAVAVGTGVAAVGGAGVVGVAAAGIVSVSALVWIVAYGISGAAQIMDRPRWCKVSVPRADGRRLIVRERTQLLRSRDSPTGWVLRVRDKGDHWIDLSGHEAVNAAMLVLPKVNRAGARAEHVQLAVREIERYRDPERFLREVASHGVSDLFTFPELAPQLRLAIEMAVNEENERIAMEGELALLELDWKDAEEIAAISDRLLIPEQVERQLERIKRAVVSN